MCFRVFFVFLQLEKKDGITQVCVRLFYSLHIRQLVRNRCKGQLTVAGIPFSDVGILNPEIYCALLSNHLVNSCRLTHNFRWLGAWGRRKEVWFHSFLSPLSSNCTCTVISRETNVSNHVHCFTQIWHKWIYPTIYTFHFQNNVAQWSV